MDIKGSGSYGAPVEAVIGMLSDRQVTVAKYESMSYRDVKVLECEAHSDSLRVVSTRVVDVDLASFATRVLKPSNTMRQTDQWRRRGDGSWEGTFDVEVQGAPIHIFGTMNLAPLDGQTVHDIQPPCRSQDTDRGRSHRRLGSQGRRTPQRRWGVRLPRHMASRAPLGPPIR